MFRERDSEIESAREEASKCDEAIEETEMERSDSRNTDDSVVGHAYRHSDIIS